MPLVSVVIPAFNAQKYICQAIQSALEQTVHDIEVIVVDDGSTDDTAAVVGTFADKRVKYVYQANQERSAARNHGLSLANGKYVAFLDADDLWHATKLEKQVAMLQNNPLLCMVGCWLQPFALSGEFLPLRKGFLDSTESKGTYVFERLLFGGLPVIGTALMPRDKCVELGGFLTDLRYGEDWELALRLAAKGPVGMVQEPLARYRVYGLYMPKKMHELGQQTAFPRIIATALDTAGLDPDSRLGRRALAFSQYYSGFVDAGIEDYPSANQRLAKARMLDETLFVGKRPLLIQSVVYFASALYDTSTPLPETLAYVRAFFANLSDDFLDLRRALRYALSLVYAVRVFQSPETRTSASTRAEFLRALYYDSSWIHNRGFLRLGAKAVIGKTMNLHQRP